MTQLNDPRGMPGVKVGSFNVNGLGGDKDSIKRNKIFNWLREKDEEIFMLQETHTVPDTEKI